MTDTPKLDDIVKMSVPDAKALLPSLNDEELAALRALETNDGEDEGRVTMLAAIEAEQSRRIQIASAANDPNGKPPSDQVPTAPGSTTPAGYVPEGQDPATYWKDQYQAAMGAVVQRDRALIAIGEAIGTEAYDPTATGVVDVDRVPAIAIARLTSLNGVQAELKTAQDALAEAKQKEQLGIAPVGAPLANYRHVTQLGSTGFELILLDGETDVDLPPIPVFATDFVQRSADTAVYDRPIALPIAMAPFRLTSVELRDDEGEVVDRCNMVPAMEAGGGRSVELPAGTLVFRQPDRSAAEAERAKSAGDAMTAA